MRERSGRARHVIAFAALMLSALAGGSVGAQAQAEAPPTEPILSLSTTAHTAPIRGIATDRENRYAVTASDDKTARVWSLTDNRLLTVLRVPIGDGDMGRLSAVAMTPDGATVAVGGWTSVSGTQENIYLFDRASGALQRRISGLPDVVNHLAYSSDGHVLAASLGSNGIRVYDAGRGYEALPSDKTYGDQSWWADFDRQGGLVTTSFDGFIRLYAVGQYNSPIAKVKGRGGNKPWPAAFSPDGGRVAVGYDDRVAVDLFSGKDLAFVKAVDTSGFALQEMLAAAWSANGQYLFAGGNGKESRVPRVRMWENGGTGRHIDIEVANETVMQMLSLKDGGTLFASADPAFGIIDTQGHGTILQGPGQLYFGNGLGSLRVSKAGLTVEQGTDFPRHTVRFGLAERRLDIDSSEDKTLTAPVTEAKGLNLSGWRASYHPSINGRRIALDDYEVSHSLALLPGRDGFILGTEWAVRRFDHAGKLVWRKSPGITWGVNVTPNGRLVVSAHVDGTIRWWRARDGQELLALFIHPDGKRWVAWTPQGYFDASVGADELIGWHVNHGFDQAPDFFPVSRFRDRFYRPDVIAKVLDTLDVDEAVRQADAGAGRMTAKAAPVTQTLPPVVQIHEPAQGVSVTETELKVTYSARAPADDPVTRVEAQIDGRKRKAEERVLSAAGDTRVGIITLELPRRDATVSVIAYNKHGASEPAAVQISWAGRGEEPKPKLYVLAIGVSNYQQGSLNNLHFTAKDAEDFVRTIKDHSAGLYDAVITYPQPPGGRWTHDAVLDGLDWIKKEPTNKDVAMVFISGHGFVTSDLVYRFFPADYDPDRLERTTVRSVEFQDFLSKVGGKVLVFLDTCYSGDVLPGSKALPLRSTQDGFANELAAAENGVVVFASSTGNQPSWEDPKWGNGAFTKALVEGLDGKADVRKAGVVRVSALEDYVYDRVKELTEGKQKPMVAKPKMVENFPVVVVSELK